MKNIITGIFMIIGFALITLSIGFIKHGNTEIGVFTLCCGLFNSIYNFIQLIKN